MAGAPERLGSRVVDGYIVRAVRARRRHPVHARRRKCRRARPACGPDLGQVPHVVQPSHDALDAARIPRPALIPRADEHQVRPHRVGAVAVHQVVRVHHVAAALGHLLGVLAQDDALVEQPQHRLVEVHQPQIAHDLGPEAGVEQVHRGVLDAAGVLVHGQPGHGGRVDGAQVVVGAQVAVLVPRRVHERVHGVRVPPGRRRRRPGRWCAPTRRRTSAGTRRWAGTPRPPARSPAGRPPAPARHHSRHSRRWEWACPSTAGG